MIFPLNKHKKEVQMLQAENKALKDKLCYCCFIRPLPDSPCDTCKKSGILCEWVEPQ